MDKPLISIITPTYNRENFLSEMIESVVSQTYKNWELIIVDDGSVDKSRDLIQGYIEKGHNIKYFFQENSGQSTARNVALQNSNGEFVCFLDSDNAWVPNKLEISLDAFKSNPEVDIVYGDTIIIDESSEELSRQNMRRYSGNILKKMLADNFISMNTTMVKRACFEKVEGFDTSLKRADDYDLWLRMSVHFSFLYLKEFLAYYRVMDDQISSNKDGRFSANLKIIEKLRSNHLDVMSKKEWDSGFSRYFVRRGRYYLSQKERWKGIGDAISAIKLSPFWQGPWRLLAKSLISK